MRRHLSRRSRDGAERALRVAAGSRGHPHLERECLNRRIHRPGEVPKIAAAFATDDAPFANATHLVGERGLMSRVFVLLLTACHLAAVIATVL